MTQPIVHIVFALSGGGGLRQALRKAGRDEKVVDVIVGLRVNVETEREGLDVTEHTERAYNM